MQQHQLMSANMLHVNPLVNNNNNNNNNNKPKRAKYNRNDGNVRFDMTIICDDVELISCTSIRNCFIGSYSNVRDSQLNSSTALAHCEISSVNMTDAVLHQVNCGVLLFDVCFCVLYVVCVVGVVGVVVLLFVLFGDCCVLCVVCCVLCVVCCFAGFLYSELLI